MPFIHLDDIKKKIDESPVFNNNCETEERKQAAKLFVELAWLAGRRDGIQESVDSLGNRWR